MYRPKDTDTPQTKSTAVLAFAATTNNDKVGLLIFTDQIELFIPPRKGTDIKLALDTINPLAGFFQQRAKCAQFCHLAGNNDKQQSS